MLNGKLIEKTALNGNIQSRIIAGGGGSGTSDYNELENLPSINDVELVGNKTSEELGLVDKSELTEYVKNTDYATSTKGGVVKVSSSNGLQMYEGSLTTNYATKEDMNYQANTWKPVTPKFLAYGVKRALIEPEKSPTPANWTEEEKASVRNLIEAVGKEDYSSVDNAGVIKPNTNYGTYVNQDTGVLSLVSATDSVIKAKTDNYRPIVSKNLDIAVKTGVTTNSIELTEEEKIAAQNWLGATNEKYVDEQITGVIEIAEGKTKSFTVATLSDLGTLLGIDTSVVADEYTITSTTITYNGKTYELKQGDIFWVVETLVPDYWVSVDDMKLYKMETTKVDLTEYVKNTDYASDSKAGVVKVSGYRGMQILTGGLITPKAATTTQIDNRHNTASEDVSRTTTVTLNNIDYAVKAGLTTNAETLTDEEKTAAQTWLDVVGKFDGSQETGDLRYTVYGQSLGQPINRPVSTRAKEGAIAQYSSGGNLKVATPRNDDDATTKKYVDDIAATIPTFTATQLEDGSYSLTIGG